jgi:glycerol-3-phosphate acyltransferase PlsY
LKDGTFSGGKAIASLGGVLLMVDPVHLLAPGLVMMLVPIALTGNLFLGQFVAALSLPFIALLFAQHHFLLTLLIVIPVLIKQWPRVIPMLQGKEPKWYWGKKKS